MKKLYCLQTNDVETHSIFFNKLLDVTGEKVCLDILPRVLDMYDQYNVKSTFFFTGYLAKLMPNAVKNVSDRGHEIACHGMYHDIDNAFDVLSLKSQISQLALAKNILQDACGEEVISFRAPALRVNKDTPKALQETGFLIDSSISSQRMDMFLSFGSKDKMQRMFTPRVPYITDKDNLMKKGGDGLVEVPLTSLVLPLVGSTMRAFPKTNKFLRTILHFEAKMNNKPIVYYMHPNEFLNEDDGTNISSRRASNYIKYLLADVLRRKLKIRNLGEPAFKLYEEQLKYYQKKGYEFITTKELCLRNGLLASVKKNEKVN